jgi:hypothetical protein
MTRKTLKIALASVAAVMIGSAALTGPAAAGGSVSITYTPTNAKDAHNLETGLEIYALVNAVKHGASIKQLGMNNLAGIGQNGQGNLGIIHQQGKGHAATLQQNGNDNAYGIFQFGKNTDAHVAQNGNGEVGTTVEFGW